MKPILHQLRTDWRRDRLWVLVLNGFFLFRLWYRMEPWWQSTANSRGEPSWLGFWLAHLAPAALAVRVILADAPANRDLGTHTRPIGKGNLVAAKALFLLFTIVVPWMLCDAWLWRGFENDARTLVSLLKSSFVEIVTVLFPCVVMAACAGSGTQFVLILLGYIVAMFVVEDAYGHLYTVLFEGKSSRYPIFPGHPGPLLLTLPQILAFALLTAAWLTQALFRRRGQALSLLVLALVTQYGGSVLWPWMFPSAVNLEYTASALTIKTGRPTSDDSTPGQQLWPTLRVAGLPPDHLASIISFAPPGVKVYKARTLPGKAQSCWSDYFNDGGSGSVVRSVERWQALRRHYGPADLWFDRYDIRGSRPPLPSVINPQPPASPWTLRLAVHQMRKIFDRPLSDFEAEVPDVRLQTGSLITFKRLREEGSVFRLPWYQRTRRTTLAPGPKVICNEAGPLTPPFSPFFIECVAVLQDPEARENLMLRPVSSQLALDRGSGWIEDRAEAREFYISKPLARMSMTGLKQEDWIRRTRLQLWVPEERGSVDFQLSVEQVQQMLAN